MAAADATLSTPPVRRAKPGGTRFVPLGFGLLAATYASAIILLPLAALVWKAQGEGLDGLWAAISAPDARAAFELTMVCSLIVVVINAIFGTMLAWVLERDDFFGKRFVNALIDLPVRAADDRRRPHADRALRPAAAPSASTSPTPAPRSSSRSPS